MYVLEKSQFSEFDLKEISNFVKFWEQYYGYETRKLNSDKEIKYVDEINLGNDLSESNVRELLRWKDPKFLTSKILSGPRKGEKNDRVKRVLRRLRHLNDFRYSRIDHDEFYNITTKIFPNGIVWRVFLFNICKPNRYPIVDQHVFRAYSYHKKCDLRENWQKYAGYTQYFNEICKTFGCNKKTKIERLKERKRVDNALMAYGRFLKKYG